MELLIIENPAALPAAVLVSVKFEVVYTSKFNQNVKIAKIVD
jgi:hypothetical protein